MNTITATYRIVTPMFIGDASQQAIDVRPPSVKGALRFWWRALEWKNVLQEAAGDVSKALRDLHQREAKLFGSAADEHTGGQGCFLLQVTIPGELKGEEPGPLSTQFPLTEGHGYLLGQGLYKPANKRKGTPATYLRSAIPATTNFEVSLRFRSDQQEHCENVANALLLLGMLGGLGSRARRGLGSIAIHKLEGCDGYSAPKNIGEYETTLKRLLKGLPVELPPFTAFSKESKIDISSQGDDAWRLLGEVGNEMNYYRSFKKNRSDNQSDHDLALRIIRKDKEVSGHPGRVVFGLPHNYYFTSQTDRQFVDIQPKVPKVLDTKESEIEGRRASPLFIHVHSFPSRKCVAVQALLKATFLPDNYKVSMTSYEKKGQKRNDPFEHSVPPSVKWEKIVNYLNRFQKYQGYQRIL